MTMMIIDKIRITMRAMSDEIRPHSAAGRGPAPCRRAQTAPPLVRDRETLDYISGHFRLFQLRDGHRFSTDDVLTAWYGTSMVPVRARTVLDLGSGIGSVATDGRLAPAGRAAGDG